jgi:hypothetical protein
VSLHFVRWRPWFNFLLLLEHQTNHVACFNARGLLYECVFDALLFFSSYRPVGKPVSHHVVNRPTFSLFLFWIIIPATPPAMMLGYYSWVHPWCPLNFFIVVSIYWNPASHRSSLDLSLFGKTTNRSAAKLICFSFFFGQMCTLFDLSIAQWLRHDLSKVAAPTPRSGACETWVPLGPHRPGSRPSPTSGSGLSEDPPTCLWTQPTKLAAHTTWRRPFRRFPRRLCPDEKTASGAR